MHLDGRAALGGTLAHHAVGQQGDADDVVEVAVADEDVVDVRQRIQAQITHACSRVDQHMVVQQEGGGLAAGSNGSGAAQHADVHELECNTSKGNR